MVIKHKISGFLAALVMVGGLGMGAVAQAQTATAPATPDASSSPVALPPAGGSATPDATAPAAAAPDASAAATPDAATPVAPPPVPDVTQATVSNPYGLGALWHNGDIIARTTLIILVIMSMGSWYVLITKAFTQFGIFGQAKKVNATFWQAGTVAAATEQMQKGTAFHYIAKSGLESLDAHVGLLDKIDIHSFSTAAIDDSVVAVQSKMQGGLALLGTVGSTAPFVGLFGTVWGIYHALTAIGIAGQASIDKVAGPVGESLIMTAIGLAVAVPAVLGYNYLVRRNKQAMEMVRKFAKKLLFVLLSSDATTPGSVTQVAAARAAERV